MNKNNLSEHDSSDKHLALPTATPGLDEAA